MSSKGSKATKSYKAPNPPVGVIVHPIYAKGSTNILNRHSEENAQDISRSNKNQITRSFSTRSSITTKLSNFIRRSDRCKTTLTNKKLKAADGAEQQKASSELVETQDFLKDRCLNKETTNQSEGKLQSPSRCERTCSKVTNGNPNTSSLFKDALAFQIDENNQSKRVYQKHLTPFRELKYLPVGRFLKLLKAVPEKRNSSPRIKVLKETAVPQKRNAEDVQISQWKSELNLYETDPQNLCVNSVVKEISKSDDITGNLDNSLYSQNFLKPLLVPEFFKSNTSDINTVQIFSGQSEAESKKNSLVNTDRNIAIKNTEGNENKTLSSVGGVLELSEEELKSTVVVVSENSQLFSKIGKPKFNQSEVKENIEKINLDVTGSCTESSLKLPNNSVEFHNDAKTSEPSEIPSNSLAVVFITTDDNTIRKIKKQTSAFAYGIQEKNNIDCSIITVISDPNYTDINRSSVSENPITESLKPESSIITNSSSSKNNSMIKVLQITNAPDTDCHEKVKQASYDSHSGSQKSENTQNFSSSIEQHSKLIENSEVKNISLLQISSYNSNQTENDGVSAKYKLVKNGYLTDCESVENSKNNNANISRKKSSKIDISFSHTIQRPLDAICNTQESTKHTNISNGTFKITTHKEIELKNPKELHTNGIDEHSNNVSYYEPGINKAEFHNFRKKSTTNTDFNNNRKDIYVNKVLSRIESIRSFDNQFNINNDNIYITGGIIPIKDKLSYRKGESQQNQDQPKLRTVNFSENLRNCNSEDKEPKILQSSYNKVNNYLNSIPTDDELLDFGEHLSCMTPSETLVGDINECYNVELDAPEEFIIAGFHDFCHTMLSLEDSSLEPYDTGTIKKRPEKTTIKEEIEHNCSSNEIAIKHGVIDISNSEKSTETCYLSISDSEMFVKTNTSDKMENTMDQLFQEIQKSKIMQKTLDVRNVEVIEAIQVLDKSYVDAQEDLSDISSNFSNQPETLGSKQQNNIILEVKSRSHAPKEDKIQCDNLIEELMLEDNSKQILDSSSTISNSLSNEIAVTISNRSNNTQMYGNSPDHQYQVNLNKNAMDTEVDQPTEEFLEYEKESHALGEMVCTVTPQTGIKCSFSSPSSSMETMSITSTSVDDARQNTLSSEAKEEIVSLPVSFISGDHSPDALPASPLHVSLNNSPISHSSQDVAACHRTSPCSVDSGTSSHSQGYFVVVAIDFGTTYSGYAFSFTRDSDNIHMMKKWDGGDPGVFNQKTPTTLLLTPEGAFHSFGYSARDYYHDLDTEEAKRWLYFDKFKMALHHSEHLSLNTEISAANGIQLLAVDVFAHALRYFKDHALQELSDQSATKILNEDVRWVVTVPAIWKQPAKQFMRAAAYNAGIASAEFSDQLLIALEPEAASIYCRRMRLHQLIPDETHIQKSSFLWSLDNKGNQDQNEFNDRDVPNVPILQNQHVDSSFNVGTRYMVVDCGGGTVDITVHEILDKHGTLKELQKATGGPYGSIGVDIEFEKLLCDIFGVDFVQQFKAKRPTGFVDLMVAFEARKRNASPYKSNPLNISLPFSFIDYYKKYKGSSVESAIKKSSHKDVKWSSQGMLRLEQSAMKGLFHQTVKQIKEHIESIIFLPELNIDHLFLVGGFAESLILQKEIKNSFSKKLKVIIPQGVSLAILKGAVLFGLDPMIVNIRRLRMTYGVGVLNRFIHGIHPKEKLVIKDGIQWCADIFDKFVVTDQSVGLGDVVVRSYTPAKAGQSCSVIHIYCSEKDSVYFITDSGVKRCGTLILDLSDSRYVQSREIQTRMMFGDTEIKVTALDVTTGKCVKSEINFLSH